MGHYKTAHTLVLRRELDLYKLFLILVYSFLTGQNKIKEKEDRTYSIIGFLERHQTYEQTWSIYPYFDIFLSIWTIHKCLDQNFMAFRLICSRFHFRTKISNLSENIQLIPTACSNFLHGLLTTSLWSSKTVYWFSIIITINTLGRFVVLVLKKPLWVTRLQRISGT